MRYTKAAADVIERVVLDASWKVEKLDIIFLHIVHYKDKLWSDRIRDLKAIQKKQDV